MTDRHAQNNNQDDLSQMEKGQIGAKRQTTWKSMPLDPKSEDLRDNLDFLPEDKRKAWAEGETRPGAEAQRNRAQGLLQDFTGHVAFRAFAKRFKVKAEEAVKKSNAPLNGYPAFATFLASDDRWMIFRKFGQLQARLILEKQDEIRLLEEKLEEMDREDFRKPQAKPEQYGRLLESRNRGEKDADVRREFFRRTEEAFKEYAQLLAAAQQLTSFGRPEDYEWNGVRKYMTEAKPVTQRESEWIEQKEDIVTLRGAREHAKLGAAIETLRNKFLDSDWNFFSKNDSKGTTGNGDDQASSPSLSDGSNSDGPEQKHLVQAMQGWLATNKESERLAERSIAIFLILLVPLFFVVPIVALSNLGVGAHLGKSIGVLVAFALTFTLVLSTGTSAKPHEVLSATAAYLAVLVVFFGSLNSGGNSSTGGG